MCARPLRPLGLPIYVARVPAAPFSLLPSSLYLDHSHCPRACASYLAALPSTRAIPDRFWSYLLLFSFSLLTFPIVPGNKKAAEAFLRAAAFD